MWRQLYTPIILLTSCFADMRNRMPSNVTHPIYMAYARLRKDILDRPVAVSRIPPCIETHFQERYILQIANVIIDINKFDEINQVMTLQFYYGITWLHHALSWNPADYDNITTIWVPSTDIWTPTIEVNMGIEDSANVDMSGSLEVASNGAVTFMKLQLLSLACDIDFHYYPFDSQTCIVGFYPHGPPHADPEIYNNDFDVKEIYNVHKEWVITKKSNLIIDFREDFNPLIVKIPTHSITLKRQPFYYVITIIFPMVLTSVMIPLVFVIPTQTGEKISYLVALFTSTAIFLNFISDVMPRSLSHMPYLAILLIEVLVEGLLAMLITLFVVNIHVREEMEAKRNKKANASNADRMLAKAMEASGPNTYSNILQRMLLLHPQCPFSKKLDRVFFVLFTVVQVIFLLVLFLGTGWIRNSTNLTQAEATSPEGAGLSLNRGTWRLQ